MTESRELVPVRRPASGSDGKTWRRVLNRLLPVSGLSGAGVLAMTALAARSDGCFAAPLHGQSYVFPSTAAEIPITFIGETDPNSTDVVIRAEKLVATTDGSFVKVQQPPKELGHATPRLESDGKTKWSKTIKISRDDWPDDDVIAFTASEVFADRSEIPMPTNNTSGSGNIHRFVGVADQPDDSNFADLSALPNKVKLRGQNENTFLTIKEVTTPSDDYYNAIGAPGTFNAWKEALGFSTDPNVLVGNEVVTFYRNENDLGFGREMHCRTIVTDGFALSEKAACYVTNYANEQNAAKRVDPIATVAMDWDRNRIDTDGPFVSRDKVRFYVYFHKDAAGNQLFPNGLRVNKIPLDGGGDKAVPSMCLNCHGGTVRTKVVDKQTFAIGVTGAHFLPFDTAILPTPEPPGPQKLAFQQQNYVVWSIERNQQIEDTDPDTGKPKEPKQLRANAIATLIEGWYTKQDGSLGLFDGSTPFNSKWSPVGWSKNTGAYLTMIAPYCRSCHSAQDALTFDSAKQFRDNTGLIKSHVCDGAGFRMPHAQRTYQKFWQSGARAVLAIDFGLATCKFQVPPVILPVLKSPQ